MKVFVYKGNEYHVISHSEEDQEIVFIEAYREVEYSHIEILKATRYKNFADSDYDTQTFRTLPFFMSEILDHRQQVRAIREREDQEELNYEFEKELQAI